MAIAAGAVLAGATVYGMATSSKANSNSEYTATAVPIETAPLLQSTTILDSSCRELRVREFKDGDIPLQYYFDIPENIKRNQFITVNFDGREFTLKIPDYVKPSEKIIVVVPASVLL